MQTETELYRISLEIAKRERDAAESGTAARCSDCAMVTIQGVACHEHGCPAARRIVECSECDATVVRTGRGGAYVLCDDCAEQAASDAERCRSCGHAEGSNPHCDECRYTTAGGIL